MISATVFRDRLLFWFSKYETSGMRFGLALLNVVEFDLVFYIESYLHVCFLQSLGRRIWYSFGVVFLNILFRGRIIPQLWRMNQAQQLLPQAQQPLLLHLPPPVHNHPRYLSTVAQIDMLCRYLTEETLLICIAIENHC